MLAVVQSSAVIGINGFPVQVEVHVGNGLPSFSIVGLPDASCREARDRVRAAIVTSGYKWPDTRITVNLAPTNLRKSGAALDVAIALGVLVASGVLDQSCLEGLAFLGELGLNGAVRTVVGVLALVHALGDHRPVVPGSAYNEAALINPDALTAATLRGLVDALKGDAPWPVPEPLPRDGSVVAEPSDLVDVQGQSVAKRALEVAAAGGHHLLMVGPPGSGKTMLAERLSGLLPDLHDEAAFDISRVYSAAGLFDGADLIRRPPFRAPHHSASLVALLGGGSSALRPGEVSLASGGVLFLDELGEYPASHLDSLRQPLESGRIHIARANVSTTLPANFLLVAATNPCPCGVGRWGECRCSQASLTRYARRLSGPLLDRFDIRIAVEPPPQADVLSSRPQGPTSNDVRARVTAAREIAAKRGVRCNRDLGVRQIDCAAPLTKAARSFLSSLVGSGTLSMRGAHRVRCMALTTRDLEGVEGPLDEGDIAEALLLRGSEQRVGVGA